jgi:hypothetical protein
VFKAWLLARRNGRHSQQQPLGEEIQNKARFAPEKRYCYWAAAACVTVNRYMFRFRSKYRYDSYLLAHSDVRAF